MNGRKQLSYSIFFHSIDQSHVFDVSNNDVFIIKCERKRKCDIDKTYIMHKKKQKNIQLFPSDFSMDT